MIIDLIQGKSVFNLKNDKLTSLLSSKISIWKNKKMAEIKIKRLDTKDTDKIVEVLLAAFEKDPLMSYFFGDRYQDLAPHTIRYMCNLANISDLFWIGAFLKNELQGIALIAPPEKVDRDNQKEIALLDEQLATAVGEQVIIKLEKYFQVKEASEPKQPHFYLDLLGVMPKSQGKGVGKAVIEALHKMSEESSQSSGVALDTENEYNLNFYQRLGYSVVKVTNLDAIKIWSMFRPNSV